MVDVTVHVQFCHIIRNIGNSQLNAMAKDESEGVKVSRLTFYIEHWTVLSISFFLYTLHFHLNSWKQKGRYASGRTLGRLAMGIEGIERCI